MYADPLPSIFDFPDPRTHAARRSATTHALQALFFMNAPFVQTQARALAARAEAARRLPAEERIRILYRLLFQRAPAPAEIALGRRFVEAGPPRGESVWAEYAQTLLMTNELLFVE